MAAKNLDETFVKEQALEAFGIALDALCETIRHREEAAAARMKRDDGAAHLARVTASYVMKREAAFSLMADAFGLGAAS